MSFNEKNRVWDVLCNPVGREVFVKMTQNEGHENWIEMSWAMKLSLRDFFEKLNPEQAEKNLYIALKCLNDSINYLNNSASELYEVWWKESAFYEILPGGFLLQDYHCSMDYDSVIQRIPYFLKLGIQGVFLAYNSAIVQSDYLLYMAISEQSQIKGIQHLVDSSNNANIKLILDCDICSTHFSHPWLQKAIEDPDGFFGKFYFFEKGTPDTPPNKWQHKNGSSCWKWCEPANRWLLCLCAENRADLNFTNENVRKEVSKLLQAWLDIGVSGFRFYNLSYLHKGDLEKGIIDSPENQDKYGYEYCQYYAEMHEYLKVIRNFMQNKDVFLSAYMDFTFSDVSVLYTWPPKQELDVIFHSLQDKTFEKFDFEVNFRHLRDRYLKYSDYSDKRDWIVVSITELNRMGFLNCKEEDYIYRDIISKLFATVMFTLQGVPIVYQGFELGIIDFSNQLYLTSMQDSSEFKMVFSDTPSICEKIKRDNHVNPNLQIHNPNSTWNFYKNIIKLRKQHKVLVYGTFMPVSEKNANVFCYFKVLDGVKFYIEINITAKSITRPVKVLKNYTLVISNYDERLSTLRPYETNVYLVE